MKKPARANARRDEFKLATPLRDQDWQFYLLSADEEFLAWQWESKRQIRGHGRPWLDRPSDDRKRDVAAHLRSRAKDQIAPVFNVMAPFETLALNEEYTKPKNGRLLLTLDIDCHYSAKDIGRWLSDYLQCHPEFKKAKKKAGRGNSDSFGIWLFQLAMTRCAQSTGNAGALDAARLFTKRAPKYISPQDIRNWRSDTMKRLSEQRKRIEEISDRLRFGDI